MSLVGSNNDFGSFKSTLGLASFCSLQRLPATSLTLGSVFFNQLTMDASIFFGSGSDWGRSQ